MCFYHNIISLFLIHNKNTSIISNDHVLVILSSYIPLSSQRYKRVKHDYLNEVVIPVPAGCERCWDLGQGNGASLTSTVIRHTRPHALDPMIKLSECQAVFVWRFDFDTMSLSALIKKSIWDTKHSWLVVVACGGMQSLLTFL